MRSWPFGGGEARPLERCDRQIALPRRHQEIHVVERSFVERAVEPVEDVDALQRDRSNPCRQQDVEGVVQALQEEEVVDPRLRA